MHLFKSLATARYVDKLELPLLGKFLTLALKSLEVEIFLEFFEAYYELILCRISLKKTLSTEMILQKFSDIQISKLFEIVSKGENNDNKSIQKKEQLEFIYQLSYILFTKYPQEYFRLTESFPNLIPFLTPVSKKFILQLCIIFVKYLEFLNSHLKGKFT